MAMTATISTNPSSTAVTEQTVTAILVISNSGTVPVTVTSVQPTVQLTSSSAPTINSGVSIGVINTGPNSNLTVPASGSLTITWPLSIHGPSTTYATQSGSNTYSIGATVYSNDGSVFAPTASTLTVNYVVSFASAQQ